MWVIQRYNKSSFTDKLLMLKEKWTKARVSLNSVRWPGGARRGDRVESASDSNVGRGKSESDKTHFPQKRCSLIFFFFDYKQWAGQGEGGDKKKKKVLNNMNIMKRS